VWSDIAKRFGSFTKGLVQTHLLSVLEEIRGDNPTLGKWRFSPSLTEPALAQFEDLAQDASRALGAPPDVDPLNFWLDRLSIYCGCTKAVMG
jgi:hypothetical protein